MPEVLAGRKFISLAISEAFAGSDVAGLRCAATKTPDGKHYISARRSLQQEADSRQSTAPRSASRRT